MRLILLLFIQLCYLANLASADDEIVDNRFLDFSIEELMEVEVVNVTSVSKRTQKLTEVASAIYVITQEDIRRSGALSIPEALRMAPGVQVARISSDKWGVSIRGFNGFSSSKVQVLMDGRSDYSPIITGTLWALQDTLMEDIDRIEVIRGPAATVWGTNAVNGIINIITKKASDTQGTIITAGGGSFQRGFLNARYGGEIDHRTPFRVYAKVFTRDSLDSLTGVSNKDQWHSARGGFRLDHTREKDELTLHGEFAYNSLGDTLKGTSINLPDTADLSQRGYLGGGHLRFRWNRDLSEQSSFTFQAAYDRNHYNLLPFTRYEADSFDVDFQHRFPFAERHDITWGGHYRSNYNKVRSTEKLTYDPSEQTNHFFSAFVRDEIALIPNHLMLTIGNRLDHNDFSGWEIQPNARLIWTPDKRNSVWLAISRAVRTPSRSEQDVTVNITNRKIQEGLSFLPFPTQLIIQGTKDFGSEKLLAYELGYRHQFLNTASIDIAGFINDYSELRDFGFGALSLNPGVNPYFTFPIIPNNKASALTYGFEVTADWKPTNKWYLQGNYSYLKIDISSSALFKQDDPTTGSANKVNPQHQFSLRSNYDFSERLQLNLWLRYTSKLPHYNIPDYITLDAKLAWRPIRNTEFFLVGQNLFSQKHREFVSDTIPSTPSVVPRGVYGGVQWQF